MSKSLHKFEVLISGIGSRYVIADSYFIDKCGVAFYSEAQVVAQFQSSGFLGLIDLGIDPSEIMHIDGPTPSKLRPILSPKYRGEVNWKTGTVTFIRDDKNGEITEENIRSYLK